MIKYEDMAQWHSQKNMLLHQNFFEFCAWLNVLEELQPKVGLEIGTYFFGSAMMMLEALPSLEMLITIDLVNRMADPVNIARVAPYKDRIHFMLADSTRKEAKGDILDVLGGRPLDFAFIDGDHSYFGVSADFRNLDGLVKSGGVIGLHDVLMQNMPNN